MEPPLFPRRFTNWPDRNDPDWKFSSSGKIRVAPDRSKFIYPGPETISFKSCSRIIRAKTRNPENYSLCEARPLHADVYVGFIGFRPLDPGPSLFVITESGALSGLLGCICSMGSGHLASF